MTASEYAATTNEGLTELVRGEVARWPYIFPAARFICANVSFVFGEYVDARGLGFVACNNVGVQTQRNPDTVRAPDVVYVSRDRAPTPLPDDYSLVPDLAVELVSLRVPKIGVLARVAEYHAAGVLVVCVLDADAGVLAVFPHDELPRRYTRDEATELPELFPDFSVPVRAFLD